MATITRFFFTRYKEVSYQTPSGQVSDEPYGSFGLDNPTQTDSGTIHFFGVMQTRHLLGDLRKITIDTGNVSLIQYDNLTDADINQRIANGIFQVNDQRIGWVDLGKATPSFFYNDCSITSASPDGKRPVVNYFYDISQLGLNGNVVSGEQISSTQTTFLTGASPIPELEVIGTFNVNETNLAWGPYPTVRYTNPSFQGDDIRQFGVSFDFYLQRVINGSSWSSRNGQIQSGTALNVIPENNTQLLSATKESHFDNQSSEKIGNRYGSVRRTLINGFRSFGQSSVGPCLPVSYVVSGGVTPTQPGITVTPPPTQPKIPITQLERLTESDRASIINAYYNKMFQQYPGFRYDPSIQSVDEDIFYLDPTNPRFAMIASILKIRYFQEMLSLQITTDLNDIYKEAIQEKEEELITKPRFIEDTTIQTFEV